MKDGRVAARDREPVAVRFQYRATLGWAHVGPLRLRAPDDQASRLVLRVGIGPGLKAAHAPLDCESIVGPINEPVFPPEHGRKGRILVGLRAWLYLVKTL